MNHVVKKLFDEVTRFYELEMPSSAIHCFNRNKYVICLIAVAWVLEKRGKRVKWLHNDYLPCFSIDDVYYDMSVPEGTVDTFKLRNGGSVMYRDSELFIVYDTYVKATHENIDFINAFSILSGGAIFPYGPDEEY